MRVEFVLFTLLLMGLILLYIGNVYAIAVQYHVLKSAIRGDDDGENTYTPSSDDEAPPALATPVNVHTRGETQFRQVGVLTEVGGTASNTVTSSATSEDGGSHTTIHVRTDEPRILPLYGRETHHGSGKWHFYTTTNGYAMINVPVFYKNKDCTHEYGCDEVFDGDNVYVQEYGTTFVVRIHEMLRAMPRYIPYH